MADFMAVMACNGPRLKDHEAVAQIISRYFVSPDVSLGVGFEHHSGASYLYIYGDMWPEAWKMPLGVAPEDFDPYTDERYPDGAAGFIELLQDLAPHLAEPLIVQAIGSTKCRFPLSACEWRIEPNGAKVVATSFAQDAVPEIVNR
jgi:hypothetical protein